MGGDELAMARVILRSLGSAGLLWCHLAWIVSIEESAGFAGLRSRTARGLLSHQGTEGLSSSPSDAEVLEESSITCPASDLQRSAIRAPRWRKMRQRAAIEDSRRVVGSCVARPCAETVGSATLAGFGEET
jgi:hypothetical protein